MDQTTGVRTLKRLKLLEVSLVTFPANDKAKISAVKQAPQTEREFEEFLRAAGFGRTQAKAIISGGFKAYMAMQRDADSVIAAEKMRRDADTKEALSILKNLNALKGICHV